jgi:hypothetical protein
MHPSTGLRELLNTLHEPCRTFDCQDPNRICDYEELARFTDPEQFPLNRVIAKLKEMPLNFLSNKDSDFFILQKKTGTFRLKSGLAEYWNQAAFKSMVRERVQFGLIRYFARSLAETEDFSSS